MSVATATIGAPNLAARRSVSALLVAALVVATGWSVLAGGWTDSTPGVLLVGLAGVAVGLLLARARVPWLLALLAAGPLLLVSLLPTNEHLRPAAAPPGWLHAVAQYADAAVTGLLGNAQWEFNVALGALLWVAGAWAAWFAVRDRRGAIATGPCWAVVAVNVINAPSTTGVTLPAALAAGAALLLIASVHHDRLMESWGRRRVSVLPGTAGRFATATLVGGALIVLLALVVPPLSSTDISGHLFGGTASNGNTGHSGHSGAGGGSNGATVRFSSATIPGGALSLSDSPVLSYTSSLSTGVYLRMETDSVFDTGNFLPSESANNNGDDTQEIVVRPGPITRDRTLADGGIGVQQSPVSLTVRMIDDSSDSSTLPFAGEPDSTSLPVRVNGLTDSTVDNQLLTVDSVQALRQVVGVAFTTTATESTASAAQLRRAGTTYPELVSRDFLGLTEDATGGAAAIRALALQWTRGATNPYDQATAIEATLRNPQLFRYTLTPPTPPPVNRMWPVTYFLTTTHAGYCQYYADAMGAMLRALGIPSRLVNGYGPGTAPNAAERRTVSENSWNVTSNDAHTWVEAYFPRYGWIPFEPTPPSQAGDYQPFSRGTLGTNASSSAAASPAATPTTTAVSSNPQLATGAGSSGSSRGRAVLLGLAALVGVGLLVAALIAAWFLNPRNARGVWRRVGVVGRLLGVRRQSAFTFDEYVDRLVTALPAAAGVSWVTRLSDALREVATLSDRAFYSADSRTDDASLKRAWRRVALLSPRLGRRVPRALPVP